MNVSIIFITLSLLVLIVESKLEPKFAPYIYTGMDLVGLHQKYGLKAVTLGFVLANDKQCVPSWDGHKSIDDKYSIAKIKEFEAVGGHVIVATGGGYDTYLENICNTSSELASAYIQALSATGSTHLDLVVEKHINADLVAWAVAEVQRKDPAIREKTFSVTIYTDSVNGINAQGIQILKSVVKRGVTVDIVNALAMSFQSPKTWGQTVPEIGEAIHKQLKQIWPQKNDTELYSMIGLTPMIGRNDEGKVFTQEDAKKVVEYAKSKNIGHLGFWALGRDNGNCPHEQGIPSKDCSGIQQTDYEFTKIFSEFD